MDSTTKRRFILAILSFVLPLTSWSRTPHSCYLAANKLAPDDFLPCYGSSKTAQYSCCQTGDKCLEGNACYDSNTGVTYQYGCTDPTFKDPHCPQKCNLDLSKSHWVGLIFCNGSKNLPKDAWVCHHPDNCGNRGTCSSQNWGDTIQRQPPTGCEDVKHGREYVAIESVGTIRDLVPLPVSSMTASWWDANADRYKTVITTAPSMPVPTTMTTVTTVISPGNIMSATPGISTSTQPTPSDTNPPDSKPSEPDLRVILPPSITLPLAVFSLLWYMFKQVAKCKRKIAKDNGKQQETDAPKKKSMARTAWEWLKNAAHHLWWPFDDIPSHLWKQCKKMATAVKQAARKAWQRCKAYMEMVKNKLTKQDPETDSEQEYAAGDHEPKLEIDSSTAESEMQTPPLPTHWRVMNRACASPSPTVQSRQVGVLGHLRVQNVGVAV